MDNLRLDLELNVTLHFDLIKAESMTRDYPGHPGSVEINAISIEGIEIAEDLFKRLMLSFGATFHQEILDNAAYGERGEAQTRNIFYKLIKKQGDTHV